MKYEENVLFENFSYEFHTYDWIIKIHFYLLYVVYLFLFEIESKINKQLFYFM